MPDSPDASSSGTAAHAGPLRPARLRPWRAAAAAAFLAALLGLYAWHVARSFVPACAEPDAVGYVILAERIANGGPLAMRDEDPLVGWEHFWVENARGESIPKFAPGMPLLMALGMKLGGPAGAFAVNPALAGLALLGAFLLFRMWCSLGASLLAALTLGTTPQFLFHSTYLLSHSADLCFATWGMFCLWRWRLRPGVAWGLAAGLVLGFAHLIRPVNALLVLPVAAAAAMAVLRRPRPAGLGRGLAALLAAYALCAAAHMAYNYAIYESPFRTGYALSDEQGAFNPAAMGRNGAHAVAVLSTSETGLSLWFAIGVLGLLAAASRGDRLLRLAWVVPLAAIHLAYYWAPRINPMGFSRFFFALFPAFIGAAFALIDRGLSLPASGRLGVMAALCAIVLTAGLPDLAHVVGHPALPRLRARAELLARLRTELPGGSVVFAGSGWIPSGGSYGGLRLYDLAVLKPGMVRAALMSRQDSNVRVQPERKSRSLAFFDAHAYRMDQLLADRVRSALAEGHPVAFAIAADQRPDYERRLGPGFSWNEVSPAAGPDGACAVYRISARPAASPASG